MNLVLDLDSTLIFSNEKDLVTLDSLEMYSKNHHFKDRVYHFLIDDTTMWGIYRPGLIDFIQWADSYFDNLIVWSAGQNNYVKEIVRVIWNKAGVKYPEIVFTYEKCSQKLTSKGEQLVYKKMEVLFDYHICQDKGIGPHNTVILDDNPVTYSYNKKNAIYILPYDSEFDHDHILDLSNDTCLDQVKKWFISLTKVDDIRQVDKEIFKLVKKKKQN